MTELYLGLPLWYWILMLIGVIFAIIMGVLEEFRRYDILVDGEFYRRCQYRRLPRAGEIEIWDSELSHFHCFVIKYDSFGLVNSYWIWKQPPEELYEKIKEMYDHNVE